ncbi:hypothetical protein JJE65_08695 [Alloprevotella tannerae]|uniref:hypothetical protein n=2 Tax=Alloprevotella tannerae TaxID=76122 RepID=UPI001EDC0C34|nr:hypothetical protein [Alloprevotella tannerae]MCG2649462.1 hypothetical protein [Alloprevotella tannerae]
MVGFSGLSALISIPRSLVVGKGKHKSGMSQALPDANERRANFAARQVRAKPRKTHEKRVSIILKSIKMTGAPSKVKH